MNDPKEPAVIRGLQLRSVLVLSLVERSEPMSVADLVAAVERLGFAAPGRAGKAIADALRWEVRRGRVRRLGRDSYGSGHVARVTRFRMRARVAEMRNGSVTQPDSDLVAVLHQ